MESIQLAQMLADLSDLNAAQEPKAATALVNANKTLGPSSSLPADPAKPPEQFPTRPGQRHHQRTGSAGSVASAGSSFMSRTASPAKFDKYGRRILTPPNTRANSAYGSIPGTPRRESEVSQSPPCMAVTATATITARSHPTTTTLPDIYHKPQLPPSSSSPSMWILNYAPQQQMDDDVDRANTLMALYEIRAKLKDQDNSRNLNKLREKIAALHARQVQAEKKDAAPRFSYPKSS